MPRLVVASYNVHGGVDGWGRPFDVVDACRRLDADVLMLQESWSPDVGVSTAQDVARQLGYVAVELPFARGRIVAPVTSVEVPDDRWGPHVWVRNLHGLRLDRRHAKTLRHQEPAPGPAPGPSPGWFGDEAATGATGLLGHRRAVPVGGGGLADHRSGQVAHGPVASGSDRRGRGAPRRGLLCPCGGHAPRPSEPGVTAPYPRLATCPQRTLTPVPSVLAGDMNLWGPPLTLLFPGWSHAVRGRTWPAWWSWPLAQSDHILVRGSVRVDMGEVLPIAGSDHLPLRAALVIE